MNIQTYVLFDAKSLIFKELDDLVSDIQETIVIEKIGEKDYK